MSYIILPEHSIIIPGRDRFRPNTPIIRRAGIGGEYRFIRYALDPYPDGSLRPDIETDWTDNLITDFGMNLVFTGGAGARFFTRTCIGSGTTAADVSDTTIETFLGVHNGTGAGNGVEVSQASPNWEHSNTLSRRFNAGTGTGMVSEVTLGAENDGTDIFSRIILPSPIDKQAANILDVIYRFTISPFTGDVIGVSTINGETYNTITRGNLYGSANLDQFQNIQFEDNGSTAWKAYDGDANDFETTPSGSTDNFAGSIVTDSYVADSHQMVCNAQAGLDDWVLGSGIRTIAHDCNWFNFKTEYRKVSDGTRIQKLSSETAELEYTVAWSRT